MFLRFSQPLNGTNESNLGEDYRKVAFSGLLGGVQCGQKPLHLNEPSSKCAVGDASGFWA